MIKTEYLKFRATQEEAREIDRICKLLGLSRSEYLRAVAFGAPAPASTPTAPAETAHAPDFSFLQADIAALKTQQEEMNAAQAQAAESFNALVQNLNEFLRVPSFREYRARDAVEGTIQKPSESELNFLIRLANRYYLLYKVWPDPTNINIFGKISDDTKANFPKAPRI